MHEFMAKIKLGTTLQFDNCLLNISQLPKFIKRAKYNQMVSERYKSSLFACPCNPSIGGRGASFSFT